MKPIAIGGDVFAGLFSAGVRAAGFDVPLHLENSNYGSATCKLNFPKTEVRIGAESWLPKGRSWFTGNVDLMFANPPCAIWSNASPRAGAPWQEDPRVQWHKNLADAGEAIEPKTYIFESVMQAWNKGRGYMLDQAERWQKLGYSVTVLMQNNMYIGGTQNRKRIFFIAHRHPLVWPNFTKPRTVRELLKPLGKQQGRPLRWNLKWCFDRSKPGDKLRKISMQDAYKGPGISFLFNRLNPDEPPPVMISYESMIHPFEPRWLNREECMVLNGAPAGWKTGPQNMGAIGAEMARAVHSGPGKWIATAVREGLKLPAIRMHQYSIVDALDPERIRTVNLWEEGKAADARLTRSRTPTDPRLPREPIHLKPGEVVSAAKLGLEKSGVFIRHLLMNSQMSPDQIVAQVHANWKGRKTTVADVAYHKGHLRKEGLL